MAASLNPELLPPALRLCVAGLPAAAKGEGDTIILGSAISFTGKDATNGILARKEPDGPVTLLCNTQGWRTSRRDATPEAGTPAKTLNQQYRRKS